MDSFHRLKLDQLLGSVTYQIENGLDKAVCTRKAWDELVGILGEEKALQQIREAVRSLKKRGIGPTESHTTKSDKSTTTGEAAKGAEPPAQGTRLDSSRSDESKRVPCQAPETNESNSTTHPSQPPPLPKIKIASQDAKSNTQLAPPPISTTPSQQLHQTTNNELKECPKTNETTQPSHPTSKQTGAGDKGHGPHKRRKPNSGRNWERQNQFRVRFNSDWSAYLGKLKSARERTRVINAVFGSVVEKIDLEQLLRCQDEMLKLVIRLESHGNDDEAKRLIQVLLSASGKGGE